MISDEISNKYDIVKILRKTAATAVLLVKDKQTEENRILKAIHKSQPNSSSILFEANLLKGLNSVQIPTIYEVGQCADWNYLIEEYIQGQSLCEYLLDNDDITTEQLINIAIEVCKVIQLLHLSEEDTILYRDMKPEHIIIQEKSVKIIDFGAAVKKSEASQKGSYCSISYAAPEQLRLEDLDERVDVYGIGKIIEYALKYTKSFDTKSLKWIAKKATEADKSKRISSVNDLRQQLEKLQRKSNENNGVKYLNKSIAIVGSTKGVGCTHIGINLCKYFNDKNIQAIYLNSQEFVVQQLAENLNYYEIKEGVLYHNGFKGFMEYGPAVKKVNPSCGNKIYDLGVSIEKPDKDYVIFVIGLSPWKKTNNIPAWISDENVIVISNFASKLSTIAFSKSINKKVYRYVKNSSSFRLTKGEKKIFNAIRNEMKK